MQLQEIDPRNAKAVEAALDARFDDLARHLSRRRAPLGEGVAPFRVLLQEQSGNVFGAAVVIGHVEGVEAGIGVGDEGCSGRIAV